MTDQPFLRWRHDLDSYRRAIEGGLSDAWFVATVTELDQAVAEVDGAGFTISPLVPGGSLAVELGLPVDLWIKNDTGNVSGSHKARHLFGVALHRAVDRALDGSGPAFHPVGALAIASCGNAALAAGVISRAAGETLEVFIPPSAPPAVVARLDELGAAVTECPRRPGETGDPCFLRYRQAVEAGAVGFTVQGPETPETLDGGRTMGWELGAQLADETGRPAHLDHLFVQIGGGALAASTMAGLTDAVNRGDLAARPALHAVQTIGCHPLVRAWDLVTAHLLDQIGAGVPPATPAGRVERARLISEHLMAAPDSVAVAAILEAAQDEPDRFMWAWEVEPVSIATGILDDLTYDWFPVVEAMILTGGWPVVVAEDTIAETHRAAHEVTGLPVCATGVSGLAGMVEVAPLLEPGSVVAVLFTGHER
ncbi:MAG: PLP-dependent lyase/thiolase [Actinomycetia bacterium]|nr:PLP-dependent lyase/thiolase [Actinomycetes bacterium]